MNLNHEYSKVKHSYDQKIITESQFNYECHKLNCVASKYNLNWNISAGNTRTTQKMVNEDYNELLEIYKSGVLHKKMYERDLKKLIAVCEASNLTFPGTKLDVNRLGVIDISSLLVENELGALGGDESDDDVYDELDDEDEFEDEDEEEESEPQLIQSATILLDDGSQVTVEEWSVNSESEYQIGDRNKLAYYDGNSVDLDAFLLKYARQQIIDFMSPREVLNRIQRNIEYYTEVASRISGYGEMVNDYQTLKDSLSRARSKEEFFDAIILNKAGMIDTILGDYIENLDWVGE